MKKFGFILQLITLTVAGLMWVSCENEPEETVVQVNFDIEIPQILKTYVGAEVTFSCAEGKGPQDGDRLFFKGTSSSIECRIVKTSSEEFTFVIAEGVQTSSYFVFIERSDISKKVGVVSVTIVDPSEIQNKDYNISGKVSALGTGVEGVVVSDGIKTTQTDNNGMYYLQSEKKRGYVFISVPSGYEVPVSGVIPQFHKSINRDVYEIAEVDFSLVPVEGQDQHIMYILGDMHLAARNDDKKQFNIFTQDLNKQLLANSARLQYVMTLGDMTWEIYWRNFNFSDYLRLMNDSFSGLPVFHTIGNHDHDVNASGDFDTVQQYFNYVGPNYYSFNIGKVHYVVLDDILCKNTGEGTSASRSYSDEVDSEQLAWLKEDLKYVDSSMAVVVASHAPIYAPSNAKSFAPALNNTSDLLACFSRFDNVHYFTGHTHEIYNVDKLSDANSHFEHNAGAVCATWWWTYSTCGMNLARDGAPGGYTICDFNGKDFEWIFKAYDREKEYQFRAYDVNAVKLQSSQFPEGYNTCSAFPENSILINIWNWDPEWKLSVKENGNELKYEQTYGYDPLHVIGYTNVRGTGTTSSFLTHKTPHLFLVKAASATSTLEIEVTDRFGNIYKESMKRPRDFKVDIYQ